MIPALAAFSVGQRLIGAAILVAILVLPAAATWLYMRGQLGAQFDLGKAECQASEAQTDLAALRTFHVEQTKVAEQTIADAKALAKQITTARARAAALSKELDAYAFAHPLPPGCRADDERVRLYNQARRETGP